MLSEEKWIWQQANSAMSQCAAKCNFNFKITISILTCEYNIAHISYLRKVNSLEFTPSNQILSEIAA